MQIEVITGHIDYGTGYAEDTFFELYGCDEYLTPTEDGNNDDATENELDHYILPYDYLEKDNENNKPIYVGFYWDSTTLATRSKYVKALGQIILLIPAETLNSYKFHKFLVEGYVEMVVIPLNWCVAWSHDDSVLPLTEKFEQAKNPVQAYKLVNKYLSTMRKNHVDDCCFCSDIVDCHACIDCFCGNKKSCVCEHCGK